MLSQTYDRWELLLVDDGSDDRSPEIAKSFAAAHPDRVRYLRHPGGDNRGMSATRNLGIEQAVGEYVALLDGDDVWLPEKLASQVEILRSRPEAALVFGRTEYWYGEERGGPRDWIQEHGLAAERTFGPPRLLTLFLSGAVAIPCSCSLLARRSAVVAVGGFEERFRGLYEDQAFYAKICLEHPVYLSDLCLERYRQHADSVSARTDPPAALAARRAYLDWLAAYARAREASDTDLWRALVRERWLAATGAGSGRFPRPLRWARKWRLRIEDRVVPEGTRRRIWALRARRLAGAYGGGTREADR